MKKFAIEAEYDLPVYVRFAVEAESEEHALKVGAIVADDRGGDNVWADPIKDFESSSRTTVTVLTNEEEDPEGLPLFQAPERPCDIGAASAAPAIRHAARDVVRQLSVLLEALEHQGKDDDGFYTFLADCKDRLSASL